MCAKMRSGLILVVLSLAMTSLFASGQGEATLSGNEIVKAGETLKLSVTLDQAPNFEGASLSATVSCPTPEGPVQEGGGIPTTPGQRTYEIPIVISATAPGGTWTVSHLVFTTAFHQIQIRFVPLSFRVIARVGLVFPSSAAVAVNPSQAQLLRREAARLEERVQSLKANMLGGQSSEEVRIALRQNVQQSIQALNETESAFHELSSDQGQLKAAQVFFDDLGVSYDDALTELTRRGEFQSRLGRVDLVSSHEPDRKPNDGPPYPLLAQPVLRAFEQNELA